MEEEYVEGEDFDEEDEDDYEYEEEDGEVEDADDEEDDPEMIEAVPEQEMINIPGLGALPIRRPGGAGPAGRGGRMPVQSDAPQEWKGLRQHPTSTQRVFHELLSKMGNQGKKSLTILLLGKTGVGKSSTVNSILAETVAQVVVMQAPASRAQVFSRTAAGFMLTLIDTPGVLEGDAVDGAALGSTLSQIRSRPVDAVLFLSRLDEFRVDASDVQVIEGIKDRLGSNIWNNTFIGFTHGKLSSLPDGLSYEEYVEKRAKALRDAIWKHGGAKGAELPVALIENSSRAPTNSAGEKLLGNKQAWLPDLMTKVADKAMQWSPYKYDAKVVKRNDPNKKRRWLIPLVLAAQIAFKVFVLDRVLEEDGITGDAYGPYDADFVAEERERVARNKERARKRKQASRQQQKRLPASSTVIEDFDDEDEFDDEEDDY